MVVEETKNIEEVTNEDTFTDKEKTAFAALKIKGQIADLEKLQEDIKTKQTDFIKDKIPETAIDFVDDRIINMCSEDVEKLSDDEIAGIFTNESGETFLDMDSPEETSKFRREYIKFRIASNKAIKEIDEEIDKFKDACKEYDDEIKGALDGFENMTDYLKNALRGKRDKASSEEAKQRYSDMIDTIDRALDLENVIAYYSKPDKARTAVVNVKSPTKGKKVIKNYEKVIASVGCKTDFRRFGGLEKHCLPENYKNTTDDAFMYSMLNYISTWAKNEDNSLNGLFLAQFSVNLKNLVYNRFVKEEDKTTFVNAICKIIDLVG